MGLSIECKQLLLMEADASSHSSSVIYSEVLSRQAQVSSEEMLDDCGALPVAIGPWQESTRGSRTMRSKGHLDSNVLQYDGGLQTTFLPGGMSFSYPKIVPRGSSFFFEFSWLLPGTSSRQRIIRTFDPDGTVVSTALLSESRTV